MAEVASEMIRKVMAAYQNGDIETAIAVWHRDDTIDALYTELIKQLHGCMNDQCGADVTPFTRLLFVARCCERVGDHITNIAENIHFMLTGRPYETSATAAP
jgi:phosphate transport system protein